MLPATRDVYLTRLGVESEPPSLDLLVRIHRAHVERVPYETLWIQMGQLLGVDPVQSAARIANHGRGGYCFHLNGGLSELLRALGFSVTRHVGGVHGPDGPSLEDLTNHLVLTVAGMPTPENPDGAWYVDVGLGDALHEPIPLLPGSYTQGPFTLRLESTPGGVGDWHLTHDTTGTFTGMSWRSTPAEMVDFAQRHTSLSTSPDSGFVKLLTVQRRDTHGVDILRGLSLRRVGEGAADSTVTTQADLLAVLADLFGIDVGALHRPSLDAMWERLRDSHQAWEAAGRP